MTSVLVVHNKLTRFVKLDQDMLSSRYEVENCQLNRSQALNPFLLWQTIRKYDCVFGWFASWHTLLPMLLARCLGKPALLVSGGYDVANLPGIGYGHQRGGFKKWVARLALRMADVVVVNSHFSKQEAIQNAGQSPDHVQVIYHGVPDTFKDWQKTTKRRQALTVGNVDQGNLLRKGHQPFARTAAYLPDVNFVLVGAWQDQTHQRLRLESTPNLTLTGYVDDKTWKAHYLQSAVYVQASLHEGFGMSLAEGMLAGCYPVVTRIGAMPEVVGDLGTFCQTTSPEEIAKGIEIGLDCAMEHRKRIRERILQHFNMEQRAEAFYKLIDSLL